MFIPPYGLGLIALALIFLLYRLVQYASRIRKCEYEVYVNTAGISCNPPRFIELMEGKTINFKLNNRVISIPHLSITKGLVTIDRIAYLFTLLAERMKKEDNNKIELWRNNRIKQSTYNQIVTEIYNLSRPFAGNKKSFKKELFKKAKDDFTWILRICEQVLDFWSTVEKQIALLKKGRTLRQTLGVSASWNSTNWDTDGKIEIKPRFG